MNVRCEYCGLDIEAPPDSVGEALRCPMCGKTFICRLPQAIVVGDQADQEPDEEPILLDEEIEAEAGPLDTAKDEPVETVGEDEESPLEAVAEAPGISADEALAKMRSVAEPRRIVKKSPRQWYILVEDVAAVALTYQELIAKAAKGEIKPRSKIYYAPSGLTVRAREIPGLFPEIDAKRRKEGKQPVTRRTDKSTSAEVAALAEALGHLGEKKE